MKQNISEINGEIDKFIIIFDSNVPLPRTDRISRQKIKSI